eukprot:CAMPEP_0177698622 /NCGR_PEP_ID=MMETSP0484_2-20121128/5144_1 /TAXON_ID=354590 /ORGANISM="Rhodomonas lens, Strain RHODO" /LENGTH=230 /DNA_ID=CAMNT_0019209737 /DNA_START=18 /DNA_END=710 /DNA_ORIENTATION=+
MSTAVLPALKPSAQQLNPVSTSPTDNSSRRSQLSAEVVLAIFEGRPKRSELDGTFVPCAKLVRKLSMQFQVKERTVRDIWNRRSWSNVTRPLWTPSEIVAEFGAYKGVNPTFMHVLPAQTRKRGRPMGSKDAIKRRPKAIVAREEVAVAVLTQTAIAALSAQDISNMVADGTSSEDSCHLETTEQVQTIQSPEKDNDADSVSSSGSEEPEETMENEWESNPIDYDPWGEN